MLTINSYEEFEKYVGQELGVSEWLEVDQDRINAFADATLEVAPASGFHSHPCSIILTISAGVTTNGLTGKCLTFPVTR